MALSSNPANAGFLAGCRWVKSISYLRTFVDFDLVQPVVLQMYFNKIHLRHEIWWGFDNILI